MLWSKNCKCIIVDFYMYLKIKIYVCADQNYICDLGFCSLDLYTFVTTNMFVCIENNFCAEILSTFIEKSRNIFVNPFCGAFIAVILRLHGTLS